jgi:hypothetical protein
MENINLNYTRLNLFGYEPELLGSYEKIFSGNNKTLINDMLEFFKVIIYDKCFKLELFDTKKT